MSLSPLHPLSMEKMIWHSLLDADLNVRYRRYFARRYQACDKAAKLLLAYKHRYRDGHGAGCCSHAAPEVIVSARLDCLPVPSASRGI